MSDYDGTILFKDWLPDQPDLNNPGLTEAKNVLPINGTYKSYVALNASAVTLPAQPRGAIRTQGNAGSFIIAGVNDRLYELVSGSWTARSATLNSSLYWQFVMYDDLVFAASNAQTISSKTNGASSNFVTITAGPYARQLGKIGQFIVAGNLSNDPSRIRWSAIDDPTNWPTPGSTTAIATQAGDQALSDEFGDVTGFANGDQYGLVFQKNAVTRMTYVGGSVVFQFDRISTGIGNWFPSCVASVAGITYFIGERGIYACDGAQVVPIGAGKVDNYFVSNVDRSYPERVTVAVDMLNKHIIWNFPTTTSSGIPTALLIFNFQENRFTHAEQTTHSLLGDGIGGAAGFTGAYEYGFFPRSINSTLASTVNSGVITTGEIEANPGGFSRMQGVKPLVDVTTTSVTVAIGTRNNLSDAVTYTSETTANSRSGFCNFRSEARYQRARLTITGTFNSAQGLEYEAAPSGYT